MLQLIRCNKIAYVHMMNCRLRFLLFFFYYYVVICCEFIFCFYFYVLCLPSSQRGLNVLSFSVYLNALFIVIFIHHLNGDTHI